MSHTQLIDLASLIAISGLLLLTLSGFGGVALASRTTQKLKFLRGHTFQDHRLLSIIGTLLLILHPIPTNSRVNFFELNKVLIEAGLLIVLLFSVWRVNAVIKQQRANQQQP